MRSMRQLVALQCVITSTAFVSVSEDEDEKANRSREEMSALARRVQVEILHRDGIGVRSAKWVEQPVFRYSDELRHIHDSMIWVWTDGGRPVAMQKLEIADHIPNTPLWCWCFTSLTEARVRVTWPDAPSPFTSSMPVEFSSLAEAPEPGPDKAAWQRQFRTIARQFSGVAYAGRDGSRLDALRLLPKPILEYEAKDQRVLVGAVFAMATGTNPNVLLTIELRESEGGVRKWYYAVGRMSADGFTLKYGDRELWSGPDAAPAVHETWTYLFLPRSLKGSGE